MLLHVSAPVQNTSMDILLLFFETLETSTTIIMPAFLHQHLSYSTEDETEIQQPISLFGHI